MRLLPWVNRMPFFLMSFLGMNFFLLYGLSTSLPTMDKELLRGKTVLSDMSQKQQHQSGHCTVHQATKVPFLSSKRCIFKVCKPMKPAKFSNYYSSAIGMFTTSSFIGKNKPKPHCPTENQRSFKRPQFFLSKGSYSSTVTVTHQQKYPTTCWKWTWQQKQHWGGYTSWNQGRYKNEEQRCFYI